MANKTQHDTSSKINICKFLSATYLYLNNIKIIIKQQNLLLPSLEYYQ